MNRYRVCRIKRLRFSLIYEWRGVSILLLLALLLILLALISLGSGSMKLSPLSTLHILLAGWEADSMEATVIWQFRMPRLLMAALAGIALAIGGCLLQGVLRNPLASPEIIGINSGAALLAVLFLALLGDKMSVHWMPLFAFIGAITVAGFIYGLSWKNGISPLRMILVGLGISALLEAFKLLFLIVSTIVVVSKAHVWITGTVYGASWADVSRMIPWFVVCVLALFILVRRLNVQVLGEDLPTTLGGRPQLQRLAIIGVAASLSALAVSFVGGIGFIGLMAPHLSRRLVGGTHGVLVVCSALVGAILLVASDLAGRTLFPPNDIPAGVFTAIIGAPFFLYLMIRAKR